MYDIYFLDQYYGRVALEDGSIEIEGPDVATVRRLLRSMRMDGQNDTELFATLPRRLSGFTHAVTVDEPSARQR